MLDRRHRLTSGRSFAAAIRRGRRAGTPTVVVHLAVDDPRLPPRVGLVVGKAVGTAVTRNQVKRRLRHLARERLESLPGGAVLVLRALPPAAGADSGALAGHLDGALARVLRAGGRR